VQSAQNQAVRELHRAHEAGACRLYVRRAGRSNAERRLRAGGHAREDGLRRGRRRQDIVDVAQIDGEAARQIPRGGDAEVAAIFVLAGDASLLDAGALDDPLVARIHEPFEIGIRKDAVRHVRSDGRDDGGGMQGACMKHKTNSLVLWSGTNTWY